MSKVWRIEDDRSPRLHFEGALDVAPASRCAACGQCCMRMPGMFVPADLEPDFDFNVEYLLRTGNYSVDWYEGDVVAGGGMDQIYFLRPSTLQGRKMLFDPSWGGVCVMLGKNGCTLPREGRPTVCKALVPSQSGATDCRGMEKDQACMLWRPYSDRLHKIALQVKENP